MDLKIRGKTSTGLIVSRANMSIITIEEWSLKWPILKLNLTLKLVLWAKRKQSETFSLLMLFFTSTLAKKRMGYQKGNRWGRIASDCWTYIPTKTNHKRGLTWIGFFMPPAQITKKSSEPVWTPQWPPF